MIKIKYLTPLLIIPLLTNCAQKTETAGAGEYDKTKSGAALGAVTGALIGVLAGKKDKGKNAAIGAAAGAAIGGAIGYSMDKQAKEVAKALDTEVDNSPGAELNQAKDIIVTNTDHYVKITFREAVMFPTNSASLTASASNKIDKMVSILRNYPTTLIQVVGHTDNRGTHSYNQRLSERRANNVASIIRRSGINNKLYKKGCSFDKPIVPNTNRVNFGLNRRVEIFLYPSQEFVVNQCI